MINKLISQLIAIKEFSKDIHYTVHGEAFYGKHEFADRIQENIADYIDELKEDILLGNEIRPLASKVYLTNALNFIPEVVIDDDAKNFLMMSKLFDETLGTIEELKDLSKGDEDLIGAIARNLQNSKGLLNLYLE